MKYPKGAVLCAPDHFTLDPVVRGVCAECGVKIMWAPHAPKVPKLCTECGMALLEAGARPVVTPETVLDLFKDWLRERAGNN